MKYFLEIIPGTDSFVIDELKNKIKDIKITSLENKKLYFESEINNIDKFRILNSALRITKENGLKRNLFRKNWKIKTSPAGINPALAYILCCFSEINENDIVFDPFCGSGTIPITAAKYFNPKKVIASDKSGKSVDNTIENSLAAEIKKSKIAIFRSNINNLKLSKNSVNKIITNPPFGLRSGSHSENLKIYKGFFKKAKSILAKNGTIVLITQEKKIVEEIFNNKQFKIIKRLKVSQGGLFPTIFKIRKTF